MERISIQEIANVLVAKSGLKKKDAERFGTTLFEVVKDGLASDRLVKIKGLGTFKIIDIEARESVNVNTGERVLIEGHEKITFTPDSTMKELVNKPFSQFETVVLNEGVVFDDMPEEPTPPIAKLVSNEEEPAPVEDPTPVEEPTPDEEPTPEEPEEPIQEVAEEPEPDIQPEPEVIQPEPEVTQPEPEVTQPEPEVTQPEPEVTQTEDIQTEELQTEITSEETMKPIYRNQFETMSRSKVRNWAVISLLMCIVSFGAGYFLGLNQGKTKAMEEFINQPIGEVLVDTQKVEKTEKTEEKAPTAKEEKAPATIEEKVPEPKEEKAPEKKDTKPETPVIDKYAEMDGRVRTGAYRIVGTDYELPVKAGETVARFSQRTLGPGMECYIEVFNGVKANTVLQEGQKLKVPKLESKIKKSSKKQPKAVQTEEQTN